MPIPFIPLDIAFIYSDKIEVTRDIYVGKRITLAKAKVTPAYLADASNPKTVASGIKWATTGWGYQGKRKSAPHQITTMKNEPKNGYKIFTLEERGQGGRAYKVISPEGFYLDMREDTLLDTIYSDGIQADGVLSGKYLFGRSGSQMKLILADSEFHRWLISEDMKK